MADEGPIEGTENQAGTSARDEPGRPAHPDILPSAGASPVEPPRGDAAAPADGTGMAGFMERLPVWTVPAVLLAVLVLGIVAYEASPTLREEVIWKYYWGPIKADAMGCGGEQDYYGAPPTAAGRCSGAPADHTVAAHSGYNVVNTLSWAGLLGLCILGAAQMLRRFRTPMDDRLILGATSWVVIGSVFHVLEDSGLLGPPLQYFFITPPIYLLFAALGIVSFLVGQYLKAVAAKAGNERALQKLWMIFATPVLAYMLLWLAQWPLIVSYVNPAIVALAAAATFFVVRWQVRRSGAIDPSQMVLTFSLGWFLLALAYVFQFVMHPWSAGSSADRDIGPAPATVAVALVLPLSGLLAVPLLRRGAEAGRVVRQMLALLAGVALGALFIMVAVPAPWNAGTDARPWAVVLALGLALTLVLLARLLPPKATAWGSLTLVALYAPFAAYGILTLLVRLVERLASSDIPLEDLTTRTLAVGYALLALATVPWLMRMWKVDLSPQLGQVRRVLSSPINLLVVFSQVLDGIATAIGIDLNNYEEKHVLSAKVIDATREASHAVGWDFGAEYKTFVGFLPLKLLVSLAFLYIVDVKSQRDGPGDAVIGLVKFAIIMVGLGPGVRDFLRLSLGV